jgi:membrane protease YdiL (CAAX protease family)
MASHGDLPFYNDQPVAIGGGGWLLLIGSVLVATALLLLIPPTPVPLSFLAAALFTGVPLATLALIAGPHWTAVFRRFGPKQLAQAFGFGLLTLATTFLVGMLLNMILPLTPNKGIAAVASEGVLDQVLFVLHAVIQLVGEEAITILPLLAVLWLCVTKFGLSRGVGLTIAVVVSTLWFAVIHLPAYNGNILQCLGAIGVARLVLTASYLMTRNLWVSSGAHIFNDCVLFFMSFAGGHMPVDTPR